MNFIFIFIFISKFEIFRWYYVKAGDLKLRIEDRALVVVSLHRFVLRRYMTNVIALKMTFYPVEFWGVKIWQPEDQPLGCIGWQVWDIYHCGSRFGLIRVIFVYRVNLTCYCGPFQLGPLLEFGSIRSVMFNHAHFMVRLDSDYFLFGSTRSNNMCRFDAVISVFLVNFFSQ